MNEIDKKIQDVKNEISNTKNDIAERLTIIKVREAELRAFEAFVDQLNDLKKKTTKPEVAENLMMVEIDKNLLLELYDFAYEQASKTNRVDDLKEIDRKINHKRLFHSV